MGIFYILVCMRSGEAALYQICIGVFVSAVFSALLEPAYRATVTDLLTKEEYSRAGGMVSIAGSARYLISPVLAGAVSDMRLLLLIDICTFFPTVIGAAVVRKEIAVKEKAGEESFIESFRQGWRAVTGRRGILILITVSALITFFMGTFQILAQPVILNFADSTALGIGETVCACGMLVSGLFLGVKGIKSGYARILSVSLFIAGIGMAGFGVRENIFCACGFGFIFFAMLPFANNCPDYLIRRNIPDALQGRAWGLIGFISQIGYVAAYGLAGAAADKAAEKFRVSVGRGATGIVMAAGALLGLTAFFLYFVKSVRALEEAG